VLEAFRAGVPVLVSDIPTLASVVENGRYGFHFEPGNAHALACGIRRTLALPEHERAAMTCAARERFLQEFTSDLMVARHEELYSQLP
jgi:glycosyltransferase involved in cell wall biosynthesis